MLIAKINDMLMRARMLTAKRHADDGTDADCQNDMLMRAQMLIAK